MTVSLTLKASLPSADLASGPRWGSARATRTSSRARGGFLQSLLNGYGGLQLGASTLALRMSLPVGVPSLTLRKVHYRGRAFSAELKGEVVTVSPIGDAAGLFATGSDGVARALTGPLTFRPDEPIALAVKSDDLASTDRPKADS